MGDTQTKTDSFMETLVNVFIGFALAMIGNMLFLPLVFGIEVPISSNIAVALLFTGLSIVRQYTIRRAFNGKSVWHAMKVGWLIKGSS